MAQAKSKPAIAAKWESWCKEWHSDFSSYAGTKEWQNTDDEAEQEAALQKVVKEALAKSDIKSVRSVYRHAAYTSKARNDALNACLDHAEKTKDALLARDVWQHAMHSDIQKRADRIYESITGEPRNW